MPPIETISVALTPEMISLVQEAIDSGEYASSSDLLGEALVEWSRKRQLQHGGVEDVRRLWQQARTGTEPGVPGGDVLDRLERKYLSMADAGE